MKGILLAAILLVSSLAEAGTQLIFNKEVTQGTVLMLAFSTNPDAVAFNDVMNVAPEDTNGKSVKRIAFIEDSGSKGLDVICAFSKLVSTTGSCTLVFHVEGQAQLDSSGKRISYHLKGAEAARLAALFVSPLQTGEVFHSTDNHFVVSAVASAGVVSEFSMTYK